jgi:hypothetical protein
MIFKWIQGIRGESNAAAETERRKLAKDSKLVDVAYEAIKESVAEDQSELENLIRMGWPLTQKKKFKENVKKKVWDAVSSNFSLDDEDMVEEITEKIVDCAGEDPCLKEIFDESAKV